MDVQQRLEKLRAQLAECEMVRDRATDPEKRELFARLSEHHKTLALDIERLAAGSDRATTVMSQSDPFVSSR